MRLLNCTRSTSRVRRREAHSHPLLPTVFHRLWPAPLHFLSTVLCCAPVTSYPNSGASQREILDVYAAVQRRCFVHAMLKAARVEAKGPAWRTQKGGTLPKKKDLSAYAESGSCPVCKKAVYAMEQLLVDRVK